MNDSKKIAKVISDKIDNLYSCGEFEDSLLLAILESLDQCNITLTDETQQIIKELILIYFDHHSGVFIS